MRHLAVLSLHTSPLVQPGAGDGGGMNVYVRELASALALAGCRSTVFTRRVDPTMASIVDVEAGFRVVNVDAGDPKLPKEALEASVDLYTEGVASYIQEDPSFDGLLANYWLSGIAGHSLKHRCDLPLATTFHTLARVKAETGDLEPQRRVDAEIEVVGCSDVILASSVEEAQQLSDHYGAETSRIEIVPPGVDHSYFSPGSRAVARKETKLGCGPILLFVGRIQPLKGLDVAVGCLASLGSSDIQLVVVGGASGPDGVGEEIRIRNMVDDLNLSDQVHFVSPQPHHQLAAWYRAADVLIMPSRSESFGLVALEASACGIPVVAADVGGLRSLVDHGRTGYLVEGRDPDLYAGHVSAILNDDSLAEEMSAAATQRSWSYTWSATAARLRRVCDDLSFRALVDCS